MANGARQFPSSRLTLSDLLLRTTAQEGTRTFALARVMAPAPALIVAGLLWLLTESGVNFAAFVDTSFDYMQHLDPDFLRQQQLSALSEIHIQPPGMALIQFVSLVVSPTDHALMKYLFLGLLLASLCLVVDSVMLCRIPALVASSAGLLCALLPSSIIYALWPYNTLPTTFFVALALWGIALTSRSPSVGVLISSCGVLGLLTFRSAFTWVFALAWLLLLLWILRRASTTSSRRWAACAGLTIAVMVVIGVQSHYFISFGVFTTSSWSGQNVLKAIFYSHAGSFDLEPETLSVLERKTPCGAELLERIEREEATSWLKLWDTTILEAEECADLSHTRETVSQDREDTIILGERTSTASYSSFNSPQHLALSAELQKSALVVIRMQPELIAEMITGSQSNPQWIGSLYIYFSPSHQYFDPSVQEALAEYPKFIYWLGDALAHVLAPGAVLLACLGLVSVRRVSVEDRRPSVTVLASSLTLFSYHAIVSVATEFGENQRFQAEITPALVLMTFIGGYLAFARGRLAFESDTDRSVHASKP